MPPNPTPSPYQHDKLEIPEELLERVKQEMGADTLLIFAAKGQQSGWGTNMCSHNILTFISQIATDLKQLIHHDGEDA